MLRSSSCENFVQQYLQILMKICSLSLNRVGIVCLELVFQNYCKHGDCGVLWVMFGELNGGVIVKEGEHGIKVI